MQDLGLRGRAYIKIVSGRAYLILRGYAGLRSGLAGTRYLADNPRVVHLVVTPRNLARSAARVTGIAVIAYATLRVVEFILHDDDGRLAHLMGTLATDIIRFAIAAGFGFLAAVVAGHIMTVVAGPLLAGIAVSLFAGYILDRLDRRLGVTESLVAAIEMRLDTVESRLDDIGSMIIAIDRLLRALERKRRRISRVIEHVNRFRYGLPRF